MGIVSSTFASLAIRFAWNCQRFLDPQYRYIEGDSNAKRSDEETGVLPQGRMDAASDTAFSASDIAGVPTITGSPTKRSPTLVSREIHRAASTNRPSAEKNNDSLHQENRRRRATQHRYRKRPSSFDVSLIFQNKKESHGATACGLATTSTPNTLVRQSAPRWDSSSSASGTTDSSDDSDIEFMHARGSIGPSDETPEEKSMPAVGPNAATTTNDENSAEIAARFSSEGNVPPEEFAMSAAEEVAFRMTVGRGRFSRSKKDRFLNNLRLEKRVNGLNKEFFELACRAHARSLRRRHSGDLRRIV